ncbi:MAG: hypothetical protein IKI59_01540, partial [Clostridia bacterium]|nr:hypothetical protein [Clostridia bacterium]
MRILHHSRNIHDRFPQGAVPCGQTLYLSCDYEPDNGEPLHLYWCDNGGIRVLPMEQNGSRAFVSVRVSDQPQHAAYCFCWFRDDRMFFYGAESGEGHFSETPALYGVTLYDGAFTTPQWFREGVAYQIFPDRFCCSDPAKFRERA